MGDREYWHAQIKEAMFTLRAADYQKKINTMDRFAVSKFLAVEIAYSCLREFLNSLPEDDSRKVEYLLLLPEDKRENPAQSKLLSKIL